MNTGHKKKQRGSFKYTSENIRFAGVLKNLLALHQKTPLHYTTLCIHIAFIYDIKDKLMKF